MLERDRLILIRKVKEIRQWLGIWEDFLLKAENPTVAAAPLKEIRELYAIVEALREKEEVEKGRANVET